VSLSRHGDANVKPINEDTEKKGGLEPGEFRRRLILVTAIVLGLGLFGGTCLGLKISERESLDTASTSPADPPQTDDHQPPSR
jgi:hypothetical protein